ncbi:MAG: TIGR00266 family protein [Rickettsiales bacterium]|nr:TIGR00266 family protein [Rickettsiales bacterium]|tara:strand:- start:228 stop:926 length:699 start_codon:yes stop_codon:yes gene_type:complete
MEISVESKPSYAMGVIRLNRDEAIIAEAGSMVAMSEDLDVQTRLAGASGSGLIGWLRALITSLLRRLVGGESVFVNRFTAQRDGSELMLAPDMVGDVEQIDLTGDRVITVQSSSFLASGAEVKLGLIWAGLRMLLAREGAFFLRCSGKGPLLINSYGAIEKVRLDGSYIVDTGHLVAFEGDLAWTMERVGGWRSTLLSGEGLVTKFTGHGTLWLQTRNLRALVSWITPQLPS